MSEIKLSDLLPNLYLEIPDEASNQIHRMKELIGEGFDLDQAIDIILNKPNGKIWMEIKLKGHKSKSWNCPRTQAFYKKLLEKTDE